MTTELEETERIIAFDDNRLAMDLFGQYDQNLAIIEQRIGVEAVSYTHLTLPTILLV